MLQPYLDLAASVVSPGILKQELEALYSTDRLYTFPKFNETARYIESRMTDLGLAARLEAHPADGSTRIHDWTMPLAWEVNACRLEVVGPSDFVPALLADRETIPQCVIFGSGFTSEEGLTAELICYETALQMKRADPGIFKDRIVFTTQRANYIKRKAARAGALGIVSCFMPDPVKRHEETFWTNTWHDDPSGWAITADCSRIFGISISPALGEQLTQALERGPVTVKATVTGRFYEDEFYTPLARIEGTSPVTVLGYAHIYEQGAMDNASGGAVLLEAARAVRALQRDGRLGPLKRSLEFLHCFECYGTIAWAHDPQADEIRRIKYGVYVDSVGADQALNAGSVFQMVRDPHATLTFTEILMKRLVELHIPATVRKAFVGFALGDNWVTDPLIGIPGVWLQSTSDNWHNSADTPAAIDYELLKTQTEITMAYMLFIAQAGPEEVQWLADEIMRAAQEELEKEPDAGRKNYLIAVRKRQIHSLAPLLNEEEAAASAPYLDQCAGKLEKNTVSAPPDEGTWATVRNALPDIGAAAGLFPRMLLPGQFTFETIPAEQKEGIPVVKWSGPHLTAHFWADGSRSLEEILRNIFYEYGHVPGDMVGYFRFLVKHGYALFEPGSAGG
ncbi:M28 family peptidase [Planctomycetota bacterium]